MKEKERLLKALWGEVVDRPPVICPGGMMNGCVTEILASIEDNHNLDLQSMVMAARVVYEKTGFENYGVPFCMTVEAEPLGVTLDLGNKTVEPRITAYNLNSIEDIMKSYKVNPREEKRMSTVLKAIKELSNDKVPVIGNITGAISTATSVIDPLDGLKMIRKAPEKIFEFFQFVNDYLIDYALEMIKSGADVIAISDPTATGEILGSKNFQRFVVPLYQKFIEELHKVHIPVIIHICGNATTLLDTIDSIGANAISFDSIVNMRLAKSKINTRLMGNVNTQLLHTGEKEKIISITKNCIDSGVSIVSPACGLSMATPVENLRAMTDYVKAMAMSLEQ